MHQPKQSLHRPSRITAPASLRLERWQRRAVYLCVGLLTLSGLAWVGAHYFLRPVTQFGETVSPLEPWSMKVHGAAAMALLFFVGSMLNGHIRRALRMARNLVSGCSMIALMAVLTFSGYGLYYLAGESSRSLWSLLHWVTGCGMVFALVLHIALGRRSSG